MEWSGAREGAGSAGLNGLACVGAVAGLACSAEEKGWCVLNGSTDGMKVSKSDCVCAMLVVLRVCLSLLICTFGVWLAGWMVLVPIVLSHLHQHSLP